jgi:predicted component of type VI protein secretion system
MSAQQILQARQGLVGRAREHGWVED